jgi:hypothetical protein
MESGTKDYLTCNPFELASFSLEKHLYMMEFDVERWYPWIEEYTFRTKFINLEMDEARAIVQRYRFFMDDANANATPPANEHMNSLISKIQTTLADFPNGAFIRLSSRRYNLPNTNLTFSPKDAPMNKSFTKMRSLIQDESFKLKQCDFFALSPNDKLLVLFNAIGRALVANTAEDAIWLLSNSERVFTDLLHSLDKDKYWDMKLIVREWIDLDPGLEFRQEISWKFLIL